MALIFDVNIEQCRLMLIFGQKPRNKRKRSHSNVQNRYIIIMADISTPLSPILAIISEIVDIHIIVLVIEMSTSDVKVNVKYQCQYCSS